MRHGWRRPVAVLVFSIFAAALLLIAPASGAGGGPCGPPITSVIACENSQPGDPPSDWQVSGVGDSTIQGFATSMGVNVGGTISFKIKTPATSYHIDILRLGYYQGNGARKVASNIQPSATLPQSQPACQTTAGTGLIDCGNWSVSASWTVPATAVSGVYIAHLVRNDTGGSSQIPFVVRNDASHSDILLSTSDATWEAYNDYGGNSLYDCTVACPPGNPQAYKGADAVSYNRPWDGSLANDAGQSYLWYAEYQLIRFMEENGYDVTYTDSSDVDAGGALLLNHKIFVSSAHDEYWSNGQRTNVEYARDHGVNLAFFSGNEVFWKTRWANSSDGTNTPYRTLVTYKETHYNAPTDPQDPPTWTGAWADPRFSPPADGGRPQNALTGQEFIVNSGTTDIQVPSQYSKLRLWRNTAVANLASGTSRTLGAGIGTLGYEWDEDADNGFRPAGEFDLSGTTATAQIFTDYGSVTTNAPATHHLTLYRAPSGALVFGAGTVQWAWGLDDTNAWSNAGPGGGSNPDPVMQQATVNLFADMGVQPATLLSSLAAATASTDATAPTSSITSPVPGASLQDGAQMTITGSSTDAGGGVVAGVEVSTDGGSTWHPATLGGPDATTVNWSYNWTVHGSPSTKILARATDDSGNIESPTTSTTVTVNCPCSIWGSNANPIDSVDSGDPQATNVGVQFKTDTFGTISGLRFYKVAKNTGTHVGSLWSSSGQLLAQATFSNETASGWQQVNFSNPVPVNAGSIYTVSYFAPVGHYAQTSGYFYPQPSPAPDWGSVTDSGPLHALHNTGTTVNGVYTYAGSSAMPTSTYNAENYWVDPIYSPAPAPGQVTGVSATPGNASAIVTWTAPSTGGPATSYVVTPYVGTTAQPSTAVTGSPPQTTVNITGLSNGTSYTFTVTAVNPNGSGPASPPSSSVTPLLSLAAPAFVQQVSNHGTTAALTLTPSAAITAGNRLVVVTGVWNSPNATAAGVTDSAGNTYTELLHFTASDGTEESVWSAPITSGSGTKPTITVKPSSVADVGAAVSEYSGLSTASGTAVLDQSAHASGTTNGATVASGPTPGTTGSKELAIGAYVDSGFGTSPTAGAGFTPRSNISGASDMDLLIEDQVTGAAGATPNATVGTGNTVWLMSTVVLKSAAPSAPAAPTNVTATAGNTSATVSWSAPSSDGGSPVSTYTITPYIGSTPQTPTTITGSPPATTTTILGLTNGTAYTFTVTATNSVGSSQPSSVSNSVTPFAVTVPGAPNNVTASAGNASATLSWTAPSNTGGSPITSYTITGSSGASGQFITMTVTGSPPSTTATVTGLTNGTTYTFTVTATNGVGPSQPSSASNPVTPAPGLPSAPTNVTATAGVGSATLSWTAPSNDGGSPVTGYTITPYIGNSAQTATTITGAPPATTATITGLTAGTAYAFTVTAINAVGSGPASAPSSSITPTGAPDAATNVTATAGNASATVSWTAPSNNGSVITSYTITPFIGTAAQTPTTITGSPPATTTTITGLTNGTAYTFTVTAANSVGSGPVSAASNAVTPAAGVPGAPTSVSATAAIGSATVSWTAPSNDGGSPIIGYTVTPYIGSTAQTTTTIAGSPPTTSTTITGLTAGTAYTFTVAAANAIGSGAASPPSNSVTPTGIPGAPTNVTASAGNASATVAWTAPSNNGSVITSYTITPYIGTTAQTATTITGSPPATTTTITGLTNGTAYTFTVKATNGVGSGPTSSASNAVTPSASSGPTFVQQISVHSSGVTSASVTPTKAITTGDRVIVLVGVWSSANATAKSVTDSSGNTYAEVLHFTASDGTEESVWTAPITNGGGTAPKITVTPTAKADVGAAALEYAGLSAAAGAAAVDTSAQNSGTTGGGSATVTSGATPATTSANELALGLYVDSGFNDTLTAGSGFTSRVNVSKTSNIELLAEDQTSALGGTPNAGVGTGANTIWLMSTVVFKHA